MCDVVALWQDLMRRINHDFVDLLVMFVMCLNDSFPAKRVVLCIFQDLLEYGFLLSFCSMATLMLELLVILTRFLIL